MIVRWSTRLLVSVTCFALAMTACTTPTDPTPVANITLFPSGDSVEVGADISGFLPTLIDAAGKVLSGRSVQWTSANTAIATVSSAGQIHGVAVGETIISATADGRSANGQVRVIIPVSQIIARPDSMDLPVATALNIDVQLIGPKGEAITGRVIQWASANPAVATVNSLGQVTGISLGTTTITARVGAKVASTRVRVVAPPVSQVVLTPSNPVQVVRIGQNFQFSARCVDINGAVVTGKTIAWNSNNPSVATVSGTGLVSALAVGSATVTAECDGKTGQVGIQVTLVPVTSVTISPTSLTMFVGQLQQLTVTAKDSAGNVLPLQNRSVNWSSDNLPVVGMTASGVATSFSAGTAHVTVTVDNTTSAPITVTVQNVPVATVQVIPNPAPDIKIGTPVQFSVILRDANGNQLVGRTVTWRSLDSSIATVSVNGLVSGVAAGGPITIEATCEGVIGTVPVKVIP
jgi:uncharacterized protein YjdB